MENQTLQYAREILSYLEEYLKQQRSIQYGENWAVNFSKWIIKSAEENNKALEHNGSEMTDILIGMHLANLSNLLKKEQNRFVSDTPFSSFMDFQFLFILSEHNEMTKSQLISANNLEMSSGIEVINRLKRSGWILEKQNPGDRRSKLIYVTDQGKNVLDDFRQSGLDIYKSYSATLEDTDKSLVFKSLDILTKLNS